MPVFGMEVIGDDGRHIAGTVDTSLQFLCDRFWGASIGDFLITGGLLIYFIIVFWLIRSGRLTESGANPTTTLS